MQDSRKLDLSQLEDVINDMDSADNGIVETKENILSNSMTDDHKQPELDSGTALQVFLDRIPISHIPGIKNSPGRQCFMCIPVLIRSSDLVRFNTLSSFSL